MGLTMAIITIMSMAIMTTGTTMIIITVMSMITDTARGTITIIRRIPMRITPMGPASATRTIWNRRPPCWPM